MYSFVKKSFKFINNYTKSYNYIKDLNYNRKCYKKIKIILLYLIHLQQID